MHGIGRQSIGARVFNAINYALLSLVALITCISR
jgi:hypothetical protein